MAAGEAALVAGPAVWISFLLAGSFGAARLHAREARRPLPTSGGLITYSPLAGHRGVNLWPIFAEFWAWSARC